MGTKGEYIYMIERKQFVNIVRALKSNYLSKNFFADNDSIEFWYQMLKQYDYKTMQEAVIFFIKENTYPPTINDLIEIYDYLFDNKVNKYNQYKREIELNDHYERIWGINDKVYNFLVEFCGNNPEYELPPKTEEQHELYVNYCLRLEKNKSTPDLIEQDTK